MSFDRRGQPGGHPERHLTRPDAALAEQVPHDEERDDQVHLAEADRDQHRVEEQRREAQPKGETPGRDTVKGWLDQT